MKKNLLLLCCLFFKIGNIKCQVTYTVDSIPFHYETLSQPTSILIAIDDIYTEVLPLEFQFKFFGIPYESFLVASNGDISFNFNNAGLYNAWNLDSISIPSPYITYRNSIFIPHHDILPTNVGAQIRYEIKGNAPYRRLIVDFDRISMFSCTSSMFYGQAILYETTNYIDINIKEKPLCPVWNHGYAILGIEDSSGTIAYSPLGRVGMTQWTALHESWRFKPSDAGPENPSTCYLKGRIFVDSNLDCISNTNEVGITNRLVELDNGMQTFTDHQGNYEFNIDTGVFIVNTYPQPYNVSSCTPTTYTVHVSSKNSTISDLNVAILNDTCSKISSSITMVPIASCSSNRIRVNYTNMGTEVKNGVDLTLKIPGGYYFDFDPIPNFNSTAFLKYYIAKLLPGENRLFEFTEYYDCSVWENQIRCFETNFAGSEYNCDTYLNGSHLCYFGRMLGKSPNSMEVMRVDHKELGFVTFGNYKAGERLEYKINFTNQLDTLAHDILVENTLDTTIFDISTFAFEGATNKGILIPIGNQFQYVMANIDLPSYASDKIKSQGSIRYSIQIKKNIDNTKIVANRAFVSFNNKPSLQTNECVLMPETKSIVPIVTDYFNADPNPISTNLHLNIQSYKQYDYAEIYNIIGQRVFKQPIHSSYEILNIAHLQKGIYSLKIYSLTGDILTKRIIKN